MRNRNDCVLALQRSLLLGAVAGVLLSTSSLHAADPVVKKLASGLSGPIAVRPDVGSHAEVFIGDGTRILRVAIDRPGTADEVITGFPQAASSKDKAGPSGLSSLHFLDHSRLVAVGGDGGQPFIRMYELPDSSSAIRFDDEKQSADIASESRHEAESSGVVDFRCIARPRANDHVSDMLLLVAACEKPAMSLWKMPLRANTFEDAVPFPAATSGDNIHGIFAIAVANSGYVALAASTVERKDGSHCMLRFIDPADGRSRLDVFVDLEVIVAMAYNPATNDLFAVGCAEQAPHEAALYRLDDAGETGKARCRAKKIATLKNPSALAFSSDGALFVTAEEKGVDGKSDGSLFKLTDF